MAWLDWPTYPPLEDQDKSNHYGPTTLPLGPLTLIVSVVPLRLQPLFAYIPHKISARVMVSHTNLDPALGAIFSPALMAECEEAEMVVAQFTGGICTTRPIPAQPR